MINPNKYIRKAISNAINNQVVNGLTIPCYDTNVSGNTSPRFYVLMTTQTKQVNKVNKCNYRWTADILLDVVCIYNRTGNTSSRVLNDDIEQMILDQTQTLSIDGFGILTQTAESLPNLDSTTDTTNVFRNLIRFSFELK